MSNVPMPKYDDFIKPSGFHDFDDYMEAVEAWLRKEFPVGLDDVRRLRPGRDLSNVTLILDPATCKVIGEL